MTARDLQRKDGQWTRGKSFDTFCPLEPCIATDIDPNGVTIEAFLNDERKQASNTKYFLFPVEEVVSRIEGIGSVRNLVVALEEMGTDTHA